MRTPRKHTRQARAGRHRRPSATARLAAAGTAAAASAAIAGIAMSAGPAQAQIIPRHTPPPVTVTAAAQQVPRTIVVTAGEYLYGIAAKWCGNPADWKGIWHSNRGITDPNVIGVGQDLTIACNSRGPAYTPPAPAAVQDVSWQQPAQEQEPAAAEVSTYSGSGSFRSCVIARESGGNSQVMNSSGHYGLYQFSAPTWAAYGGSPADFGHASVAEQNQVFSSAMAQDGESNWSAYDGC